MDGLLGAQNPRSPLVIRPFRDDDQDTVWDLHNVALQQTGAHGGNGAWDDDLHHISDVYFPNGDFLVGELGGEIVAMGAIKRKSDECAELKRMRVHPDFQGRGYGQQMLDALQERARELGYLRMWLDTTVLQVAAQALYTKNGFVEAGRGKIGPFDLIYFEKALS
jgi:GNAT superfamily N-acetyltransferase